MKKKVNVMGIILSCFKGIGKTYLTNTSGNDITISDLSEYSGDTSDFVDTVLSEVKDNDIVFVSSDEKFRTLLNERGVDYDVFYPSKDRRKEFIENEVRKHTNSIEIRKIDNNFDKLVDEIDDDEFDNCYKHKLEKFGEYIGNNSILMSYITEQTKNKKK